MTQLIVIVMAIALSSFAVMAGVNYMEMGNLRAKEKEAYWSSISLALAQAWADIYHRNYRDPISAEELKLAAQFSMPMPAGYSLSSLAPAFKGWCISGSAGEDDLIALLRLAEKFPTNYGLSNECGKIDGLDQGWLPSKDGASYPLPIVITYRLGL